MILVTGASGNNGSELIRRLSARRIPVRAMIHRQWHTADEDLPGVDFVAADFDDPASVRRVLKGVDRAFLVTNSTERAEAQQLAFVETARAAGVRHIVYLSQLHADARSPVRFLRYHAAVENAIAASGMTYTHLRPNLYMQGLLGFRESIRSQGRFFAPAGDARVSLVDVRDIAAVADVTLTQPGHAGRIYEITGPEALTHTEIAAQLSEAVGTPVAFVDTSEQAMRDTLLSLDVPQWQADGLIEDYAHYRRGEASAVSRSVEEVTGAPPRSFRSFCRDYRQAFLAVSHGTG